MWLQLFGLVLLAICSCYAEPPVFKSGPYPAAGWRPSKPFNFPKENLPPSRITDFDFEVSKAHLDYIGNIESNNAFGAENKKLQQPQQEYLPPNSGFFKKQNFNYNSQFNQPMKPQTVKFRIIYPDVNNYEEAQEIFHNKEDSQNNHNDYEASFKSANPDLTKKGQYYVLGSDKTLHRVLYTAMRDEGSSKAFTAHLKYTPIGEIRDPVYKYNNQGQLERILKK